MLGALLQEDLTALGASLQDDLTALDSSLQDDLNGVGRVARKERKTSTEPFATTFRAIVRFDCRSRR